MEERLKEIEERLVDVEARLKRLEISLEQGDRPLTIQEAADYLGVSTQFIYSRMKEGKLTPVKNGEKFTRFLLSDVRRYLREHREAG